MIKERRKRLENMAHSVLRFSNCLVACFRFPSLRYRAARRMFQHQREGSLVNPRNAFKERNRQVPFVAPRQGAPNCELNIHTANRVLCGGQWCRNRRLCDGKRIDYWYTGQRLPVLNVRIQKAMLLKWSDPFNVFLQLFLSCVNVYAAVLRSGFSVCSCFLICVRSTAVCSTALITGYAFDAFHSGFYFLFFLQVIFLKCSLTITCAS